MISFIYRSCLLFRQHFCFAISDSKYRSVFRKWYTLLEIILSPEYNYSVIIIWVRVSAAFLFVEFRYRHTPYR